MTDENTFYVEPLVRLWTPNERDTFLDVGRDGDDFGLVELRTGNEKSAQYYGEIRLALNPDMARQLGRALIEVADRLDVVK